MKAKHENEFVVTKNACKLCTPLGAALAYKGVEGCVPLLHGSQGCSTYIRRYMISHFKEPVDIASSNFSEDTAIFGGEGNLKAGLRNITQQYAPNVIGIATTCLSETIGDDVPMILREYRREHKDDDIPLFVHVSTASYRGTHADGFHSTVRALVETLAEEGDACEQVNVFPGMISPADIRHIKEILTDFGLDYALLPDYSQTLDGGSWETYHRIPAGGTPVARIQASARAKASVAFGRIIAKEENAALSLMKRHGVPAHCIGLPFGIRETDRFFRTIEEISGRPTPLKYVEERERLVDAYADGHKYVFGVRAAIYGEEDFVVALAALLAEIGVVPVICASGGKSGHMEDAIREVYPEFDAHEINVLDGKDFIEIEERAKDVGIDMFIGNSKAYTMARRLNVPVIRRGFPVHDRFGGGRLLHVGYRGTQALFDDIVNTVMERRQADSPVGYTYM